MAKWSMAISLYMTDLQFVQNEYTTHRQSPPLARDLPPVAGKIAWSRQLYNRISGPVKVFQKEPLVMKQPETRRAIKAFNKLAQVLVEYEVVHLRVWNKRIAETQQSLNATLLIRDPDTQTLHVNFDPKVSELMREIDVMSGMGIDVPATARVFRTKREGLKAMQNSLKVSVLSSLSLSCQQSCFFLSVACRGGQESAQLCS